jgi:hypothetical protein
MTLCSRLVIVLKVASPVPWNADKFNSKDFKSVSKKPALLGDYCQIQETKKGRSNQSLFNGIDQKDVSS